MRLVPSSEILVLARAHIAFGRCQPPTTHVWFVKQLALAPCSLLLCWQVVVVAEQRQTKLTFVEELLFSWLVFFLPTYSFEVVFCCCCHEHPRIGPDMNSTWNPAVTVLLGFALLFTLASAASFYVDDYYDENVDASQDLMVPSDLQPPPFYSTAPFSSDESNDESNESESLTMGVETLPSSSSSNAAAYYDYLSRGQTKKSKNNDKDDSAQMTSNRAAFKQWLKAKRLSPSIPTLSKRSPACMRKCISQRLLHPAQCHSLC